MKNPRKQTCRDKKAFAISSTIQALASRGGEVALGYALDSTYPAGHLIVSPLLCGSNPYPRGSLTYRILFLLYIPPRFAVNNIVSKKTIFEKQLPKRKKYCTIIWQLTEMYRSGHNGTDSKSVDGVTRPWVRIPPSPPTKTPTEQTVGVLLSLPVGFCALRAMRSATRLNPRSVADALP